MLARFFIDRPIFAVVVSIVITLAGTIALFSLPVAQYPQITPPSVSVAIISLYTTDEGRGAGVQGAAFVGNLVERTRREMHHEVSKRLTDVHRSR